MIKHVSKKYFKCLDMRIYEGVWMDGKSMKKYIKSLLSYKDVPIINY